MKKLFVYLFAVMFVATISGVTFSQIKGRAPVVDGEESVARAGQPKYVANQVIVQYHADASEQEKSAARAYTGAAKASTLITTENRKAMEAGVRMKAGERAGGEVELDTLPSGTSVKDAIEMLKMNPAVKSVEPNWIYTKSLAAPNDPYFTNGSLWGMYGYQTTPANTYGTEATRVWNTSTANGTGSRSIYIAVIDEGMQVTHPDLSANIWNNPFDPVDGRDNDGNGYIDDTNGWDFAGNNRTVYDGPTSGSTTTDSHGTHVAGTIGAVGNNGIGVVGVNWKVTIISCKFLGASGGTTANAIKAFDYVTDLKRRHGIDIVATNNSWGGGGYSQALADAIGRASAQNILTIVAAGNETNNNDAAPSYPASYTDSKIIAVASITSTGGLSSFSNYGKTSVDIGAPGSNINSTLPVNRYGALSGTSMATPHVSGAVALYAANRTARGTTIKTNLMASAYKISSLTNRCVTGGTVDLNKLFTSY